jgi:hypothetical protein
MKLREGQGPRRLVGEGPRREPADDAAKRRALNRRRFLQAVGATALTYPFLRALPSYAMSPNTPTYLILVFTPCGVVRYLWGAQGPARPTNAALASPLTGSSGAGAFRATLAPFATGPTVSNLASVGSTDLTNQVTVLDGLNVATAAGSHQAGMAALWTGIFNEGVSVAGKGMSIDQAIAAQLNAPTPFPSIPLMVYSPAAGDFTDREVQTRMLYNATDFQDPCNDPAQALSTYFPSMGGMDGGVSPKNAIRQVVFNQINTELTALQGRMCNDDAQQLGNIQEAWNALSAQLVAAQKGSCGTPDTVPAGTLDFPTSAKLMMDALALAVACDRSRVLSLQFSTATSNITHTWIDPTDSESHHQHSHSGPSSLYALGPDLYDTATYNPPGIPDYDAQLPPIDLWYANQVAYLAEKLSSLNMLAQSVICWGSELDMGQAHTHDDSPFVLIGGGGGALKTGQLVQFPLNLANNASNNPPTNNRFHNDLLITLAQVMGVSTSTFGSVSGITESGAAVQFCTGPIKEILA